METTPVYEIELLQQVAKGDERAFSELFKLYNGKVFNFIRPYALTAELAEETVQDIFTQVWLARDTLPEIKKFSAFLFVVSRNYALNALKKYAREKKRLGEWQQHVGRDDDSPFKEDPDTEKLGLIERAVANLPEQQKKVWRLARHNGLKYTEISEEMGISVNSVKKYMHLALTSVIRYTEDRLPILIALSLLEKL